jgi:hypothetical protein
MNAWWHTAVLRVLGTTEDLGTTLAMIGAVTSVVLAGIVIRDIVVSRQGRRMPGRRFERITGTRTPGWLGA